MHSLPRQKETLNVNRVKSKYNQTKIFKFSGTLRLVDCQVAPEIPKDRSTLILGGGGSNKASLEDLNLSNTAVRILYISVLIRLMVRQYADVSGLSSASYQADRARDVRTRDGNIGTSLSPLRVHAVLLDIATDGFA